MTKLKNINGTKRVDRELPVRISEQAAEMRSQELAGLICEQTAIENELAAFGADKRKRLRALKKDVKRLATSVRDREELAMVTCEEETVFAQNKIIVRRLDSNAIVETRAMTGEDRQLEIDQAAAE